MSDKRVPPNITVQYFEPKAEPEPFVPRWLSWLGIWLLVLGSLTILRAC